MRWELYPLVYDNEQARKWLEVQHLLRYPPNTIEAYGRSLNDYLVFCKSREIDPEHAGSDQIALYVNDLACRPNPRGKKLLEAGSEVGFSNSTIQLRLTAIRLFYNQLVEEGLRQSNPVGRGKYTPGNAFAGKRERALLKRFRKLPWIPGDDEWRKLLAAFREEPLRNRLMLLLAYDGALRRGELLAIEIEDLDFPQRQLSLRPEVTKSGTERVVGFSKTTATLLVAYLHHRRGISAEAGALFLSESRRNLGEPLSASMWNKVVRRVADRADLPSFTPHTLRHLRLTHMARAGLDLHEIAIYAGHRALRSTGIYIHLSGAEIAEKVARYTSDIDRMVEETLE